MTNNHKPWIRFSIFFICLLIPFQIQSSIVFQGGVPNYTLKPNPLAYYFCNSLSSQNIVICHEVQNSYCGNTNHHWRKSWLTPYQDGSPPPHDNKANGVFDCVNTEAFLEVSPPSCINIEGKLCECWVCADATGVENEFNCFENPETHVSCSAAPPPPTTTIKPTTLTIQPATTGTQPPTTTTTTTTQTATKSQQTTTKTTTQPMTTTHQQRKTTQATTGANPTTSDEINMSSSAAALLAAAGASVAIAGGKCCMSDSSTPNGPGGPVPSNFVADFAGALDDVGEMMNPDDVVLQTQSGDMKVSISLFKAQVSPLESSPRVDDTVRLSSAQYNVAVSQ